MFGIGFDPLFLAGGMAIGLGRLLVMLNELLTNAVADIQGLNLKLGTTPVAVVKRKGVKREPTVDASTQITVCKSPKEPLKIQRTGFQKTSVIYPIEIAIVSANNRDWVTNLDTYIDWFDSLIALYVPPSLTTTNLWGTSVNSTKVFDVRVIPGDFLEPEQMANMFDVIGIDLEVSMTFTS